MRLSSKKDSEELTCGDRGICKRERCPADCHRCRVDVRDCGSDRFCACRRRIWEGVGTGRDAGEILEEILFFCEDSRLVPNISCTSHIHIQATVHQDSFCLSSRFV